MAILPQLFLVSKTGEAESITSHYLFALGSYRCLYLFNWIYRYYAEEYYDLIAIASGVVQTVLYCDFFYLYITKGTRNSVLYLDRPLFLPSIRFILYFSRILLFSSLIIVYIIFSISFYAEFAMILPI